MGDSPPAPGSEGFLEATTRRVGHDGAKNSLGSLAKNSSVSPARPKHCSLEGFKLKIVYSNSQFETKEIKILCIG